MLFWEIVSCARYSPSSRRVRITEEDGLVDDEFVVESDQGGGGVCERGIISYSWYKYSSYVGSKPDYEPILIVSVNGEEMKSIRRLFDRVRLYFVLSGFWKFIIDRLKVILINSLKFNSYQNLSSNFEGSYFLIFHFD